MNHSYFTLSVKTPVNQLQFSRKCPYVWVWLNVMAKPVLRLNDRDTPSGQFVWQILLTTLWEKWFNLQVTVFESFSVLTPSDNSKAVYVCASVYTCMRVYVCAYVCVWLLYCYIFTKCLINRPRKSRARKRFWGHWGGGRK